MADYDFLQRLSQLSPRMDQMFMDAPQIPQQQDDFMGPINQPDLGGLYQPSYERMNAYGNAVDQMPVRTEPGKLRNIGASLASLGAIGDPLKMMEIKDQGKYAPYYRQMQDFGAKLKPLEQAAKLEGARNDDQRIISNQQEMRRLEAGRLSDRERQTGVTEAKNQADAEHKDKLIEQKEKDRVIRERRVAVSEFVAKNKGRKVDVDEEGHIFSINPETNEAEYVLSPDGERVKTDDLSDAQKLDIQHKNRLSEISARGNVESGLVGKRGEVAKELEGTKQTNRAANIESVFEGKKKVKETSSPNTKTEKPQDEGKVLRNKANQLKIARPDLAPYIKVSSSGVEVTKPGLFGDQTKVDEARALLSGGTPGVLEKIQRNTNTGETRTMISKDGGKTWQPK